VIEIEKGPHLRLHTLDILGELLLAEQIALGAFAAGVANHSCGAADDNKRLMTRLLKTPQGHEAK
jgi:hypothetical protein